MVVLFAWAWAPFYPVSTGCGFCNNLERIPHALLFLQEFYDITKRVLKIQEKRIEIVTLSTLME
jgi:hypothetical protein